MKLLADLYFPGWEMLSTNRKQGHHWSRIRKMDQPPIGLIENWSAPGALVKAPHPRRTVNIIRFGPRALDKDNLYASAKPALDRIKSKKVHGQRCEGYIYDDSEKYCDLIVTQEYAPSYDVRAMVYEGTEGD